MDIDRLQIEIVSDSTAASKSLDSLSDSLAKVKSASSGGAGLERITKSLQGLKSISNSMDLKGISSQIEGISSAIAPLNNLGKNNLSGFVNSLKKIPDVTDKLSPEQIQRFGTAVTGVVAAVRPLATEMEKIYLGFSAMPARIQTFINRMDRSTTSAGKASNGYRQMGTSLQGLSDKFNITALYYGISRATNLLFGFVTSSNEYVEDINLFTVALGRYADEAYEYAMRAQALMGIDAADFLRNEGIFQNMATGFGVASDKAYILSKNLTQLSYDAASFFNLDTEEAFLKFQSGIAGELEPVRRLGYALDQATLQQVAYNLGITESIRNMTQAEKAQIRYIAIMQQSKNVMGDMARTLETPANSMRIFQAQVQLLGRSLGNILIPSLMRVLPYVIAFVKVLRMAADAIAAFVGFTLPTIDYSGMTDFSVSSSDAADGLEDAAGAAKKLKDYVLGIDELNILSPDTGSGGGSVSAGGGSGLNIPIEDYQYDFLDGLQEQADKLIPSMKRLAIALASIVAIMAAAKFIKGIIRAVEWFGKLSSVSQSLLGSIAKVVIVVATIVAAFAVGYLAAYNLTKGIIDVKTAVIVMGVTFVAASAILTAIMGPIGILVAGLAVLTGAVVGNHVAMWQLNEELAVSKIFAENGGIPIRQIADEFNSFTSGVIATSQEISKNSEEFANNQEVIKTASTVLAGFSDQTRVTADVASTVVPQMKTQFDELFNAIISNAGYAEQALILALVDAPQAAYDQSIAMFPHLASVISTATSDLTTDAQIVNKEFQDLYEQWQKNPEDAELFAGLQEAGKKLTGFSDEGKRALEDLQYVIDDTTAVDFSELLIAGDIEGTKAQLVDMVNGITESGANAQAELAKAYETVAKSMDTLDDYMSPEDAQALRDFYATAFEIQSDEIQQKQSAAIDLIKSNFDAQLESVAKDAAPSLWDNIWAWAVTGGYGASEMAKQSASDALKKDFEDIFAALDTSNASMETSKGIIDGIAQGLRTGNTSQVIAEAKKMGELTVSAVNEGAGVQSPSWKTAETGMYLNLGLANGITDNTYLAVRAATTTAEKVIDTTALTLGIYNGKESVKFTDYGKLLMLSIASGITFGAGSADTALKNALNPLLNRLQDFSNRFKDGINSTLSSYKGAMGSIQGNGKTVSFTPMAAVTIPSFANGGTVNSGQIFMANENRSPELIGQFGSQTGIMNSGQIVEAVTSGVARGVSDAIRNNADVFQSGQGDIVLVSNNREMARAVRDGERKLGSVIATRG